MKKSEKFQLTKKLNKTRIKQLSRNDLPINLEPQYRLGFLIRLKNSKLSLELQNLDDLVKMEKTLIQSYSIHCDDSNVSNLYKYYDLIELFAECSNNRITNIYPYKLYSSESDFNFGSLIVFGIRPINGKYYYNLVIVDCQNGNVFLSKNQKVGHKINTVKIVGELENNLNLLSN